MAAGGAGDTRRLLNDSIEQIARLPPGSLEVGAFNGLRRGVLHALGGKEVPPGELLAGLEPKGPVLRHLLDLHEGKRMYRKQIASVISGLLGVDAWVDALKADGALCQRLPEEFRPLVAEVAAATGPPAPDPQESPAPAGSPEAGTATRPSAAQEAAGAGLAGRAEGPEPAAAATASAAGEGPGSSALPEAPAAGCLLEPSSGQPALAQAEAATTAAAAPAAGPAGAAADSGAAGGAVAPPRRPSAPMLPKQCTHELAGAAAAAAASPAAEKTRKLLQESAEAIARLPPGDVEGGLVKAFGNFRRGVMHATSSGCLAVAHELLGSVEPKDVVLKALALLFSRKRMYQKQVADVWQILLQADGWVQEFRASAELSEAVPEGLRGCLDEALARPVPAKAPVGAGAESSTDATDSASSQLPSEDSVATQAETPDAAATDPEPAEPAPAVPTDAEVRAAVDAAHAEAKKRSAQARRRSLLDYADPDGTVGASRLLTEGREQIAALGFKATDTDGAIGAFETFRRAVAKAVRSPSKEDDELLERLEPKGPVLEFLLDLATRKRQYGQRIAATLTQLLDFEGWRSAAQGDPALHAAVRRLARGAGGPGAADAAEAQAEAEAPATPMAEGGQLGAGSLYVRVVAAYDLACTALGDLPRPCVRVALEGLEQRTEAAAPGLDARWEDEPFILGVSSAEAVVRFEVLDGASLEALGGLELGVGELPRQLGPAGRRYLLAGTSGSSLELELAFACGAELELEAAAYWAAAAGEEPPGAGAQSPQGGTPQLPRSRSAMELLPGGREAKKAKARWMYADAWGATLSALSRWSKQMPAAELLRALEDRPEKHRRRPVLIQIEGVSHKCKDMAAARALLGPKAAP